ncbi:MAG: TetR/AcrR family transcriptional regulator [Actinomycetota bacterium]|nr:TetR/AcrR family transcriptional regulator [Actinomycetota bacterium]
MLESAQRRGEASSSGSGSGSASGSGSGLGLIADRISGCAQRLADQRGLDGFTMDDLAGEVGVSRRTLFNHVPGKIDAVLGCGSLAEPEPIATFRQGGPTGDLVADIREAGAGVMAINHQDPEEFARLQRVLRSDPRLMNAMLDRFEAIADHLTEAIREREGDAIEPLQARILARFSLGLSKISLDEFIADPSVSAADHYLRVFDSAVDLFR